jgi:hypothetical protein
LLFTFPSKRPSAKQSRHSSSNRNDRSLLPSVRGCRCRSRTLQESN